MKKGFVLIETIVVIAVLCVVLVSLYAGYYNIIRMAKTSNLYDNTEYLYYTSIVGNYLGTIIDEGNYKNSNYYVYCNNRVQSCNSFSDPYFNKLVNSMQIRAVYVTKWNTTLLDNSDYIAFEATTQNYIKQLDPDESDKYRIIVMYEDKRSKKKKVYQYASIEFSGKHSISI